MNSVYDNFISRLKRTRPFRPFKLKAILIID